MDRIATKIENRTALHRSNKIETLNIRSQDFFIFLDRAFDGMLVILEEMGDELANQKPDFPGANSPYAILFHCVGVVNYWIGTLLGERDVLRDRPAEFFATGSIHDIANLIKALKAQTRLDLERFDGACKLLKQPERSYSPIAGQTEWTQGWVLMHAYEELAQHHGQLEISRDWLKSV